MNIQTSAPILQTTKFQSRSEPVKSEQAEAGDCFTFSNDYDSPPDGASAIVYGSVGVAAGTVAGNIISGDLQGALLGATIGLVAGGAFGAFAVPHINL